MKKRPSRSALRVELERFLANSAGRGAMRTRRQKVEVIEEWSFCGGKRGFPSLISKGAERPTDKPKRVVIRDRGAFAEFRLNNTPPWNRLFACKFGQSKPLSTLMIVIKRTAMLKNLPPNLSSILLLFSGILLAQPHRQSNPGFRVAIPEGAWFQGDIFSVGVTSRHPIQQIQASFVDRKLNFFPDARRQHWTALVGIDIDTKPGRHVIRGTIGYQDQTSEAFQESLEVLPKEFPEERVEVDEEYVTPSPENTKRAEAESRGFVENFLSGQTLAGSLSSTC